MTDVSELIALHRSGDLCASEGQRCKVMDAESGCTCAKTANALEALARENAELRNVAEENNNLMARSTRLYRRACEQNAKMAAQLAAMAPVVEAARQYIGVNPETKINEPFGLGAIVQALAKLEAANAR